MSQAEDPPRIEMALLRATRAVRSAFNAHLAPIGLSMTEASLLNFLDEHGSLTQRQLADRLKISAASAGSTVDALVGRGLVERQADPADRRVWRVVLTPAAATRVVEFRRVDAELQAALRAGMARSERQVLAQLLTVLEANAVSARDRAALTEAATGDG